MIRNMDYDHGDNQMMKLMELKMFENAANGRKVDLSRDPRVATEHCEH